MRKLSFTILSILFLFASVRLFSSPTIIVPPKNASSKTASIIVPGKKKNGKVAENVLQKKEIKSEIKNLQTGKSAAKSPGKSKVLAAVLAFFLGTLGVHSFYMGQTAKGFIQLGISAVGIGLYVIGIKDYVSGMGESFPTLALVGYILLLAVGIWALVDFIRILTGGLQPEEGFDS